jgi:hypothetical protein
VEHDRPRPRTGRTPTRTRDRRQACRVQRTGVESC